MKHLIFLLSLFYSSTLLAQKGPILSSNYFKHYIESFNQNDNEYYKQAIPNKESWKFLKNNIPVLECPDKELELTYYFRWWTFRKHIKKTSKGFIITEFLPNVPWAGVENSINCPVGHHFYEGRWLKNSIYLHQNAVFWLTQGDCHQYSTWLADALWNYYKVSGDHWVLEQLNSLTKGYDMWEKGHDSGDFHIGKYKDGLFATTDNLDGMEASIGGSGKRITLNSYMYGDLMAISQIAKQINETQTSKIFKEKALKLKKQILDKLWDSNNSFFKTMYIESNNLSDLYELHGYTPWYFNLPPDSNKYSQAWSMIMDPNIFYAPYGLTSASQNDPRFALNYQGHECQWNGPSWPYATSITLTGLANLLNNYSSSVLNKKDYYQQLLIYAKAQRRTLNNGIVVPWIDENINPYTGDWISRTRLEHWENNTWNDDKGGKERGKDYNHSTFCDLIISGLIGVRPQAKDKVVINPLIPNGYWDWFCLDNIPYKGHTLTILYDKNGTHYHRGKGFFIYLDEVVCKHKNSIEKIEIQFQTK